MCSNVLRSVLKSILFFVSFSCVIWLGLFSIPSVYAEPDSLLLTELHNDPSFDESDFPSIPDDYSLSLITLAEGSGGKLFAYIYQPGGCNLAYSIRIAVSDGENALFYEDRFLILYASSGPFFKYLITGISVPSSNIRYYSIVQIERLFIKGVDSDPGEDNVALSVPFNISREYKFWEENGEILMDCKELLTINIENKFVGRARYVTGHAYSLFDGTLYQGYDRYFIAFSTSLPIEQLLSIRIDYDYYNVFEGLFNDVHDYHSQSKMILCEDSFDYSYSFLWYNVNFSWDRITTVSDFISSINDVDVTLCEVGPVSTGYRLILLPGMDQSLNSREWVVSFDEFGFCQYAYNGMAPYYSTLTDVTILQMSFIIDGEYYNLGVVDNRQVGSTEPINLVDSYVMIGDLRIDSLSDLWNNFKTIIKIVALVILFLLLLPILKPVLKFVFKAIQLPFNAVKVIKKKKERHSE